MLNSYKLDGGAEIVLKDQIREVRYISVCNGIIDSCILFNAHQ